MVREKEVYGVIVIDKSEADIGVLIGKRIEHLKHLTSIVPGKTTKGGWSQARYQRIREGLLRDFMKMVGDIATNEFRKYGEDLKGVIIAGPGPIKEDFYKGDFLGYDIKKKILGIVNTSYTGEYGLEEAINRAENLLTEASIMKEKAVLEKFFTLLARDSRLVAYGLQEVANALQKGNVEVLLISEKFDYVKAKFKCNACSCVYEKIIERKDLDSEKCKECGGDVEIMYDESIEDRIVKVAEDTGATIEFISTDTREGKQFLEMGGIGAILRFALS